MRVFGGYFPPASLLFLPSTREGRGGGRGKDNRSSADVTSDCAGCVALGTQSLAPLLSCVCMCVFSVSLILLFPKEGVLWTKHTRNVRATVPVSRSRPNQITGPGPKSGPAGKSESGGPENGVSRWRRPNSAIYSQNHHFRLVYDMKYQFLGMDAKNYKFGMFCQQCHPSVASGDADIRPRNASRIHTRHLFTL